LHHRVAARVDWVVAALAEEVAGPASPAADVVAESRVAGRGAGAAPGGSQTEEEEATSGTRSSRWVASTKVSSCCVVEGAGRIVEGAGKGGPRCCAVEEVGRGIVVE
jgi:hypothetical protein